MMVSKKKRTYADDMQKIPVALMDNANNIDILH